MPIAERFGRQRASLNPGRFRSLLTLQPTAEADGAGDDSQPSWTDTGAVQVHGLWVDGTQVERIVANTRFAGASGVWQIPWVPDILTSHRVVYGSRHYRIIGIDDVEERGRVLHLYCSEDEGANSI